MAFLELQQISIRGIACTVNSLMAVLSLPSVRKLCLEGLVDDHTHVDLEPRTSKLGTFGAQIHWRVTSIDRQADPIMQDPEALLLPLSYRRLRFQKLSWSSPRLRDA